MYILPFSITEHIYYTLFSIFIPYDSSLFVFELYGVKKMSTVQILLVVIVAFIIGCSSVVVAL